MTVPRGYLPDQTSFVVCTLSVTPIFNSYPLKTLPLKTVGENGPSKFATFVYALTLVSLPCILQYCSAVK